METTRKNGRVVFVELPLALPTEHPGLFVQALQTALAQHEDVLRLFVYLFPFQDLSTSLSLEEVEHALAKAYQLCLESSAPTLAEVEVNVLPPRSLCPQPASSNLQPLETIPDLDTFVTFRTDDNWTETLNERRGEKGLSVLSVQHLDLVTLWKEEASKNGTEDTPPSFVDPSSTEKILSPGWKVYQKTCLGGTFDRLHAGHKLMLTIAILSTSRTMILGITGAVMLKNKKYGDIIQPYALRAENTLYFCNSISPFVHYNAVELHDGYGPTTDDTELEAVIVSAETKAGAFAMNNKRQENNVAPLDIIVIGLIPSSSDTAAEKLSSTALREKEALMKKTAAETKQQC
ncbi:Bifunctional coenzyme A synthase [Balamuthia mandrillaris]